MQSFYTTVTTNLA